MIECKNCRHHKGDCMLTPDSEEECPVAIEKAFAWINTELLSLNNAPQINGCEMTDEWRNAINALEIAKKAIEQINESKQAWVSVNERFPEELMNVLVFEPSLNEPFISYYDGEKWPMSGWWVTKRFNPTHWMLLPTPPTEVL